MFGINRKIFSIGALACMATVLCSGSVFAQETVTLSSIAETAKAAATSGNYIWICLAAFMVFFMQAGFAMVEVGFTRSKNAANIIMKNLMDFSMGTIFWLILGYGLMFGADAMGLFGTDGFMLSSGDTGTADGMWQYAFWLFQCVFAATAATIVSGAMAERTKFVSYLAYSAVVSGIIYPISGHWIWGGGWLSQMATPFIDFAGSTVVHSVGGWLALCGAIVLGPRIGKYGPDGKPKAILGHNLPLAALGVFILWFGWFGFNPGSTTEASPSIGLIAVTTNLAAAAGTITAMFTAWIKFGKPDCSMSLNGSLAGLVAITAGCANVSPMAAVAIGAIAGVVVVLSIVFIDQVLKIDDPVGAISVHGVCGALGTILTGVFASEKFGGVSGLLEGNVSLLVTQLIGVVSVFIYCMVAGFILFYAIKSIIGLRVSKKEELRGLDIEEHGNEAYNGFQIFITQ